MLGDALEEPLFEHGHSCDNTGLATSRERVQLNVARDECGDKLGIRCCACATTPDRLADIVDLRIGLLVSYATRQNGCRAGRPPKNTPTLLHLFAVLIRDNGARGCACIRTEYNSILEETADDSGTSAGCLWDLHAFALKEGIAIGSI